MIQEQLTSWAVHGGKHNKSAKRQPTERAKNWGEQQRTIIELQAASKQRETIRNREERQGIHKQEQQRETAQRNPQTKRNSSKEQRETAGNPQQEQQH
jgi:hypothetical protein